MCYIAVTQDSRCGSSSHCERRSLRPAGAGEPAPPRGGSVCSSCGTASYWHSGGGPPPRRGRGRAAGPECGQNWFSNRFFQLFSCSSFRALPQKLPNLMIEYSIPTSQDKDLEVKILWFAFQSSLTRISPVLNPNFSYRSTATIEPVFIPQVQSSCKIKSDDFCGRDDGTESSLYIYFPFPPSPLDLT